MNNSSVTFWFPTRALLCSLVLLFMIQATAMGQTLKYEAFHLGRKVGSLTVTREVSDERTKIKVDVDIRGKLKPRGASQFETHSTYMDQKLIEAQGISKWDSNLNSLIAIYLNKDRYYLEKGELVIGMEPIDLLSTDIFYFEEPLKIKQAVHITSGDILTIERKEDVPASYTFTGPRIKIVHHYKAGKLTAFMWQLYDEIITFRLKNN